MGFAHRTHYSGPWRYCCARCRACCHSAVAQFRCDAGLHIQRVPLALFGGQAEPGVSLDPVLGYAGTGAMKQRQAVCAGAKP